MVLDDSGRPVVFVSAGIPHDVAFAGAPLVPAGEAKDPAAHDTFSVTASKDFRGEAIWTDLHWSELDQARPERERRVVVTVQKAIEDGQGRFLGVFGEPTVNVLKVNLMLDGVL